MKFFNSLTCFVRRYWPLIIWILLISLIFWSTYNNFKTQPQYYYLRNILGYWLCVSRGSAPVLLTCSVLVLLPVCRSLHTLIHRGCARYSTTLLNFWLVRIKHLHMICAFTLILFALIHTGAHIMNAIHFSKQYNSLYPEINFAKFKGENPALLICTWTGCSGFAMLLLLLIIAATSTSTFRAQNFNTFYITHHLFIVYLLLLLTHPLSGILKEQSNIQQHIPGCIVQQNFTKSTKETIYCHQSPKFKCISTQGWIWVMITLIIYLIELLFRKYQNCTLQAIEACHLLNKAIYLKLKCPENFQIDPGQYILLQNYKISNIEWHPFTVTKCPTSKSQTLELIISVRGDWTKKLHSIIQNPFIFSHCQSYISRLYHQPLTFSVDGPFSSPMQFIKNCKYVICVAAGVGITSYIATLHYFLNSKSISTKRLLLIWLIRDPNQIFWFAKLFCDVQNKFWENNEPDKFQIRFCVTKNIQKTKNLTQNHKLKSRIYYGRPNWKDEFRIFNFLFSRKTVYLFCCGPKSLSNELRKRCLTENRKGYSYNFIKEAF